MCFCFILDTCKTKNDKCFNSLNLLCTFKNDMLHFAGLGEKEIYQKSCFEISKNSNTSLEVQKNIVHHIA